MDFITIQTPRLELIGMSAGYINQEFENNSKEQLIQKYLWNEEEYNRFHHIVLEGSQMYRMSMYAFQVYTKENKKHIGECGLHTWNTKHHRSEIYYMLKDDADKQKGYMSETLQYVLPFAFETLKMHRIQALIEPNNIASIRLAEKFNFKKEGILRQDYLVDDIYEDSVCYSLLKQELKSI